MLTGQNEAECVKVAVLEALDANMESVMAEGRTGCCAVERTAFA